MKNFSKNFILSLIVITFCGALCSAEPRAVYKIDASRNASLHNNKGVNHLNEKNYYAAIKEFEIAILINPNTQASAVYYNNLGKTYLEIGYPNMAQKAFQYALKRNSANFEFYQNLVQSYKAQNILKKELDTALNDNRPVSKVIGGLILIESGQKELGVNMLDEFCFDEPEMILTKGVKKYLDTLGEEDY